MAALVLNLGLSVCLVKKREEILASGQTITFRALSDEAEGSQGGFYNPTCSLITGIHYRIENNCQGCAIDTLLLKLGI